jgi:hypothetical protein
MGHVVTASLAVITDSAGTRRYVYQGAPVPDDVPESEIRRLADLGMITETGDDTEPDAGEAVGDEAAAEVERPPQGASKAAWVDYAVARGTDRESAESMTKQELIDAHSPSDEG